jgi:hypothetical protein
MDPEYIFEDDSCCNSEEEEDEEMEGQGQDEQTSHSKCHEVSIDQDTTIISNDYQSVHVSKQEYCQVIDAKVSVDGVHAGSLHGQVFDIINRDKVAQNVKALVTDCASLLNIHEGMNHLDGNKLFDSS